MLTRVPAAVQRPTGPWQGVRPVVRPTRPVVTTRVAAPQQALVSPTGLPAPAAAAVAHFRSLAGPQERLRALLGYAAKLAPFPPELQQPTNRVMGCTAQVWVSAALDARGRVQLSGTSDSEISRGLVGLLATCLSGLTPYEVLALDPDFLGQLGLGPAVLAPGRANGAANMLEAIKRRTRALTADLPRFPSLMIRADGLEPQGAFALAQAQYLEPDAAQVDQLAALLRAKRVGVVAHFYMDPQVQGVLTSAYEQWPHVAISDSLVMADTAVRMAEAGCTTIAVLGVDFMSENVRAILDEAGHTSVRVMRMDPNEIGCSLAEAAESDRYMSYLNEAAATPKSLHVVYINTSLRTKALADQLVPTITCTSSNVVQTVLQAFAQVPDGNVFYGPDTYMGRNLAELFASLAEMDDEEVAKVHPGHTRASIRSLLPRLRYFDSGTCIVHHIFGGEVVELLAQGYGDAFLTAHFEVPGEMFGLAMAAKKRGMGVVGSTSNILDFIADKVKVALAQPHADRLQFVLGTESGMITSIVRKVQSLLRAAGRSDVEVEVVFPVSPSAITTADQTVAGSGPVQLPGGLTLIPGPAAGEGCSLEGGCASCPYMKMNSLTALTRVCQLLDTPGEALLEAHRPKAYAERVGGKTLAAAGCVPILHMRHLQKSRALSDALVQDIVTRNGHGAK